MVRQRAPERLDELLAAAARVFATMGYRRTQMADIARERSLRELAAAGVHIHLLPAMLHAKYLSVDGLLATCGSINLDGRSLFLNYELNAVFHDPAQIVVLERWFATQCARCTAYTARAPGWWRDLLEGMVRSVGYQL